MTEKNPSEGKKPSQVQVEQPIKDLDKRADARRQHTNHFTNRQDNRAE